MYTFFNASNDILFYVVAARSTKVFLAQLTNGALLGAVIGGLSQRGFDLLKHHENNPSVLQGWGLGVYNGASLIGIYPHYVFRKNNTTGQWESDGGITFGFGHYVSQAEYGTDATEKALVDKYAKGAPLIPSNIPSDGVSVLLYQFPILIRKGINKMVCL